MRERDGGLPAVESAGFAETRASSWTRADFFGFFLKNFARRHPGRRGGDRRPGGGGEHRPGRQSDGGRRACGFASRASGAGESSAGGFQRAVQPIQGSARADARGRGDGAASATRGDAGRAPGVPCPKALG